MTKKKRNKKKKEPPLIGRQVSNKLEKARKVFRAFFVI